MWTSITLTISVKLDGCDEDVDTDTIESLHAFCGYLENMINLGTVYEAQRSLPERSDELDKVLKQDGNGLRTDIVEALATCACHECIGIVDHLYNSHTNCSDLHDKPQLGHEGTSVDGTVDDATFFKDC